MKIFLSLLLITSLSWTSDEIVGTPSVDKDIVAMAAAADNLTTLVSAIKAGGLASTLEGEGPFTVFAPSDEAFAALPAEKMASLLDPANKQQLVSILTFHVLPENAMETDLHDGMKAKTVNGDPIIISEENGAFYVNGAKISTADIAATNGTIHIIDQVLLPADM